MRAWLLWCVTCLSSVAGERRIASYSPGATQTLLDLGGGAEIVMATRWCPLPDDHPAARSADIFLPDLERLLLAKPDLVIIRQPRADAVGAPMRHGIVEAHEFRFGDGR